MEGQKWEELDQDCLVKVFQKMSVDIVGFESLLVDIPFVSKSWYKASLAPECRKILNFSILSDPSFVQKYSDRFGIKHFSNSKFLELVARRSTSATTLALPSDFTVDVLDCFSSNCPSLTYLSASITYLDEAQVNIFAEAVGKFKFLLVLDLDHWMNPIDAILAKISLNCGSFSTFFSQGPFTLQDASAITTYTPRIKALSFKGYGIYPGALQLIISGCRELEFLDIRDCSGVDIDEEILKKVTHLKDFLYTGCRKLLCDEAAEWSRIEFEQGQFDQFLHTSYSELGR